MLRPILILLPLLACSSPGPTPLPTAGQADIFDAFRQALGQSSFHGPTQRLIFHAVLRGLFEDGVRDDVIGRLTRTDQATGMPYSFVYACPVCMPAFNALRVYAQRPEFYGDKQGATTFGPGLSDELRQQLLSADGSTHRGAVNQLIGGWLREHIDSMRLTDTELAALDKELERLSERGLAQLRSYLHGLPDTILNSPDLPASTVEYFSAAAEVYAGWETCPSCDGASDACTPQAPAMLGSSER